MQRTRHANRRCLNLICIAFIVHVALLVHAAALCANKNETLIPKEFEPMWFIKNHTSFFPDFKAFREHWFAVEHRISGIKDEYEPVDWAAIRQSAKQVVVEHERLMVKFARDCRSNRSKLPPNQAAQAQRTIETVQEYLDSVGLVVLKLYEIAEKLYKKTVEPYSYTMSDYNADMRHFKDLNKTFENKGKALNRLFYGK